MPSNTNNNKEYFSIEAPHKPRRQNYFWTTLLVTLTLLFAVGVAFLGGAKNNNNDNAVKAPTTLGNPSSGLVSNDKNSLLLDAHDNDIPKSFHVDMDKQEWPELVNVDAEIAKQTIQGENPSITRIQIFPQDSIVTMDYVTTRVRIFVKEDNTVARPPRIGWSVDYIPDAHTHKKDKNLLPIY